jgi:hypothetical protein
LRSLLRYGASRTSGRYQKCLPLLIALLGPADEGLAAWFTELHLVSVEGTLTPETKMNNKQLVIGTFDVRVPTTVGQSRP